MRNFQKDDVPAPEGYSVAHAILGFDEDGDLLIVQCDEHWEPFEYDKCDQLFHGAVQRFVYYRKTEKRMPETVTYLRVNDDNSVSLVDTVNELINEVYQAPATFFPRIDSSDTQITDLPQGEIYLKDYLVMDFLEEIQKKRNEMMEREMVTAQTENKDALLARALSQPRKSPFEK